MMSTANDNVEKTASASIIQQPSLQSILTNIHSKKHAFILQNHHFHEHERLHKQHKQMQESLPVNHRQQHHHHGLLRTKIELHLHLDGSIRTSTILEVAKSKKHKLPASTVDELEKYVTVAHDCTSLTDFIKTFGLFLPVFLGDAEAIERIAYELCEDEAKHGVCYFEARYAPHLLQDEKLSAAQVVEAVNKGLARGMNDFHIYAKSILCCMRGMPENAMDVVHLADRYRKDGVVGIDLAGDEINFGSAVPFAKAFQHAATIGVNRTVHAGEAGPAENVLEALDILKAQRIGHGYRIVDRPDIYERIKRENIHLECCLTSSLQTGAVSNLDSHPITKFSYDNLNFSLNTDDAQVCRTNIQREFSVAIHQFYLDPSAISRSTFNAAQSAFLEESDRKLLLEHLLHEYAPHLAPKPSFLLA